jgi:hypothetical protein
VPGARGGPGRGYGDIAFGHGEFSDSDCNRPEVKGGGVGVAYGGPPDIGGGPDRVLQQSSGKGRPALWQGLPDRSAARDGGRIMAERDAGPSAYASSGGGPS